MVLWLLTVWSFTEEWGGSFVTSFLVYGGHDAVIASRSWSRSSSR